jgi:hypothetical protein
MASPINFRAVIEDYLATHAEAHLYFLLDHSGLPRLLRKLDSSKLPWASLFEDTRESSALAVAPILVEVAVVGKSLPFLFLDWVAEHGAYSSTVTMLDSPLALDVLKRRLAARLDIKLSENTDAMLRFFDPRILAQLRMTLTEKQAQSFFSVAAHWWYIDRAGVLREFDADYTPSDGNATQLVLTQEQEFAMVDAAEADQVLSLLNDSVPNLLERIDVFSRYDLVVEKIVDAKKIGLNSIRDLMIYFVKYIVGLGSEIHH